MTETDDLVLVATFSLPGEAEVAASMLEGAGIESLIDKPFVSGVRPDWIFGIDRPDSGVRLFVRREDADVANALLEGMAEEE
jgi:hypothetical protein